MLQVHCDELTPWTVRIGDETLPLKNFSAAIAYADGLASSKGLVKHIHPERKLISLVPQNRMNLVYDFRDVS